MRQRFAIIVVLAVLISTGCAPLAHVPPDPGPAYTYAEDALRRGDYQEAIVRFDAFLGRTDSITYRPRALYQLAWAHYELHQYRQTLDMLNQLTAEFPNEPGPQVAALRGNAEYALGNQTNGFLAWEQAWQRGSFSDQQALRPRMEQALDSMSEPELRQIAALTTDPEVSAMVQPYLDQPARIAKTAPIRKVKPAPPPEHETLPSGELYSSPAPVAAKDTQPKPGAEVEVAEEPVADLDVPVTESGSGHPGSPKGGGETEEDVTIAVEDAPLPPTAQPPQITARVAALLPLTGSNRQAGWDALNALRLAFLDNPNSLIVRDTAGEAPLAKNLLAQLAADPSVVAVIGPLGATEADAIGKDADRLKIPLVPLAQPSEARGRFVVRVVGMESTDANATMSQRFQQYTGRSPTKTESQVFLIGLAVRDALSKGAVTRDSVVADLAAAPFSTTTDIAARSVGSSPLR